MDIKDFCKWYSFEILFTLVLFAIVATVEKYMMLYFMLFILLTASFIAWMYLFVTDIKTVDKKDNLVAINKFKLIHGCEPKDKNFVVIDFYKHHNFYIYASSDDVLAAYKLQQKIICWIIKDYVCSWVIIFGTWIASVIIWHNIFHTSCLTIYIFAGFWIMLYRALSKKMLQTEPLIEINK